MKYRFVNNINTDVSCQLKEVLISFYKLAHIFHDVTGEDPGDLMPGWLVNDNNANFADRFLMFADAATAWGHNFGHHLPKDITAFVISGLLADNYYVLFTVRKDNFSQDEAIMEQLKKISSTMAEDIIQQAWRNGVD